MTACEKKEPSCYELYRELRLQELSVEIYPYRSDLVNATFFSRLYHGISSPSYPDEFSYCDDYYVALSSGSDLWELHIFHTVSAYDLPVVRGMLQERRDRLQRECASGFYNEITHERITMATIFSIDQYVFLCITDHNDLIKEEMQKILKKHPR